ncbi:MAG TPA: polyphenol oxidase family protein [Gemmatimonadaceae bacterium]|nr:polyphenol oxidase family protein [Gemmatimonadaceae bacterium]
MIAAEHAEVIDDFSAFGVHGYTTTRAFGTFGAGGTDAVREVMGRWDAVVADAASRGVRRLATAKQVHGASVIVHVPGWEGWLRCLEGDGHASTARGTALAVTIADCVPVFLAHPSGAVALLHSGWRGTAARIVERGIDVLAHRGCPTTELRMHLGPAVCGACYEVSAEVYAKVTGESTAAPRTVDLRAIIAEHARARGVAHVSISPWCTRHHNDRFFSHRAGDAGRQIAVLLATPLH